MSKPRPARIPRRILQVLCVVSAVMVLACGTALSAVPTQAMGMTCDKATARPNEDGGDGVIGGETTRLTWEGTVETGEDVTKVTLTLPEGGSFDGSSTRVTVLEGLTREDVTSETSVSGTTLDVTFADAIPEGSLVRLEVTDMSFPSDGGDYTVTGSYVTNGATKSLPDSQSITVIANTPLQAAVTWLDNQAWVDAWNSNQFLGMFFKPQLLLTSFVSLFSGWVVCLGIVIVAYPIAIVLGLCFAFMKLARHRVVRAIAVTYINVLRGTPLFLQIYIMFFGLPMVGINIDNNVLGVIVMAVNSSAYLAEIFRAGIESIPQGQYEAAASLGMNRAQTMVSIILPQTVRRVIPTVTSDFITSYKDTSLLSSVGVMELMMFSKNLTTVSGNITPYMAAAVYYLIVTLPLIKVVGIVEKRIARSESGGSPRPKRTARLGSSEPSTAATTAGASVHCEADPKASGGSNAFSAIFAPFRPGGTEDTDELIARIDASTEPGMSTTKGGVSDAC